MNFSESTKRRRGSDPLHVRSRAGRDLEPPLRALQRIASLGTLNPKVIYFASMKIKEEALKIIEFQ